MKRTPDVLPIQDHAYHATQFQIHWDQANYKAPVNNLESKEQAFQHFVAAQFHLSAIIASYYLELEKTYHSFARDEKS